MPKKSKSKEDKPKGKKTTESGGASLGVDAKPPKSKKKNVKLLRTRTKGSDRKRSKNSKPGPINCWTLFVKEYHSSDKNGSSDSVTKKSPVISGVWQALTEDEKNLYREKAKELNEIEGRKRPVTLNIHKGSKSKKSRKSGKNENDTGESRETEPDNKHSATASGERDTIDSKNGYRKKDKKLRKSSKPKTRNDDKVKNSKSGSRKPKRDSEPLDDTEGGSKSKKNRTKSDSKSTEDNERRDGKKARNVWAKRESALKRLGLVAKPQKGERKNSSVSLRDGDGRANEEESGSSDETSSSADSDSESESSSAATPSSP